MMIQLSQEIKEILDSITQMNFEAYIVGGYVRDALRGIQSRDIDITTNASFDVLLQLFEHHNPTPFVEYGVLKFMYNDYSFEICRYRKELEYTSQRKPKTLDFNCTLEEDVMRRDFTINAILYHPNTGILDFVGGVNDIDNGVIKSVGNPKIKLKEDLLRIIRMARFASETGFEIEEDTLEAARHHAYQLRDYPLHWWYLEFSKLINGIHFESVALEMPWLFGALIIELEEAIDFNQDNPYHCYSLYEHLIRVSACLIGTDLRIAGLFHDIGKLTTKVFDAGRARYKGHALKSVETVERYLTGWGVAHTNQKFITIIIENHDRSFGDTLKEISDVVLDLGFDMVRTLVAFKRCDNYAKTSLAQYQIERCAKYDMYLDTMYRKSCISIKNLDISGYDLIQYNVEPENRKHILDTLFRMVVSDEVLNEHDALIAAVGRIL